MPTVFQITDESIDEMWNSGGPASPRMLGRVSNSKVVGPVWVMTERLVDSLTGTVIPAPHGKAYDKRTIFLRGIVVPIGGGHRENPDPPSGESPHGGLGDVDRGHLLAIQNGGPNVDINIVPQWGKWQRGEDWRQMELLIHKAAVELYYQAKTVGFQANSPCLYYEVKVYYPFPSFNTLGFANAHHQIVPVLPAWDKWVFPYAFSVVGYQTTGAMTAANNAPPAPVVATHSQDFSSFEGRALSGRPEGVQ